MAQMLMGVEASTLPGFQMGGLAALLSSMNTGQRAFAWDALTDIFELIAWLLRTRGCVAAICTHHSRWSRM